MYIYIYIYIYTWGRGDGTANRSTRNVSWCAPTLRLALQSLAIHGNHQFRNYAPGQRPLKPPPA